MEYKMNQELTTAVEAIKTAILQSPNSSDASDELTQYFQFQILSLGTKYERI